MDRIYKYFRDNEYTLDSLKNNYLWFSKPQYLNDPFDCNMEIIQYFIDFLNAIENRFPNRNVIDSIINHARNLGICCFSETNDNQDMWELYADSHKGICVEYKYSEKDFDGYFSKEILKCKCVLQKVDYRDNPIDLNGDIEFENDEDGTMYENINTILSLPLDNKKIDILFEKLFHQKNKQLWGYEKERRLLLGGLAREQIKKNNGKCQEFVKGYVIPIKREMITSIIFGGKTSDKLKNEVRNIFGSSVAYKQVGLDFENWELKIE